MAAKRKGRKAAKSKARAVKTKPSAVKTKPSAAETKPSAAETKPSAAETKLGATKTKSAARSKNAAPKDLALLQKLVDELIDAKGRGDDGARDAVLGEIAVFLDRPLSLALRSAADEALAVARNPITVDSLRLLGDLALRLKAVPAERPARARPASAARNLLLPKVATTANSMLEAVLELQQATDSMKAQLDKPKELGNLPELLSGVKRSLEKLKERAKALQA